ncbi:MULTISPECIES: hypothetical protein [unclassified Arenibacter]|jgi:protein involved in sex pheromone biosynthesis|uniref:hypothetical protein n=1 Tax=Flavobacteriaceae TaxID=49546 RepID=UPI000E34F77C|nr:MULTISPECIES: hypothetical protein [unclassified Arenibacter]MCM4164897.1 hypothetical protein [Arenibacter sp. A80]RFT55312.1 hypothetical protein D0S24_14940 [Arenibacter sp. P308M17]|tara:strand:- start:7834 stop:8280 length:447 start_codon:yes stop_codon:yes gene_type:complete
MKTKIKMAVGIVLATFTLSACAQKQESSVKDMLKDPSQQDEILTLMVEDHDLGKKYITKMMDNDHATGMMVDELVNAAANDTILAGKLSDMISRYPDLMLLTTHHFMPVIANDSLLSDTFCDHTLEHKDLEKAMHNKMEYKKSMEKNH